jgi:UDP-N-acetyl-2-amino-2-deoxyglucuronate dehydrogenase
LAFGIWHSALRLGIIGAGGISATHVRAARAIDGLEVTAVYGANPVKTRALAESAGATSYDDFDAFLAHPMDLVAIGSPSALHADQGLAAARRGLHVLVEKPLDTSLRKIDALIEQADRAGVKLGVFFQERLSPDLQAFKIQIESGEAGAPLFVSGQVRWYRPPEYYAGSRWRGTWQWDGGGALMNQGIHTVDALLWLCGPIVRVTGRTATRMHRIEVEDTASALLEFESGAFGTIEATTAAYPGHPRRIEITGTKATLVHEEPPRGANVSDATPHRRVLEDFLEAIRTNRAPACDGREGRRSVAVVDAIYRSAKSGGSEKP